MYFRTSVLPYSRTSHSKVREYPCHGGITPPLPSLRYVRDTPPPGGVSRTYRRDGRGGVIPLVARVLGAMVGNPSNIRVGGLYLSHGATASAQRRTATESGRWTAEVGYCMIIDQNFVEIRRTSRGMANARSVCDVRRRWCLSHDWEPHRTGTSTYYVTYHRLRYEVTVRGYEGTLKELVCPAVPHQYGSEKPHYSQALQPTTVA